MSAPDFSLLGQRRFGPIFVVQFLGAFNDNLLKFAMLFLANYGIYASAPQMAEQLGVIATGLFTLPYFLLSALAGQVADRIDKARLIRWIKVAELGIMVVGLIGFAASSIPLLLGAIFPDGRPFHLLRPGQILDPAAASFSSRDHGRHRADRGRDLPGDPGRATAGRRCAAVGGRRFGDGLRRAGLWCGPGGSHRAAVARQPSDRLERAARHMRRAGHCTIRARRVAGDPGD
ncbi:hypothetical protein ACFSTD_14755 [Novosphingobium colocasiae]